MLKFSFRISWIFHALFNWKWTSFKLCHTKNVSAYFKVTTINWTPTFIVKILSSNFTTFSIELNNNFAFSKIADHCSVFAAKILIAYLIKWIAHKMWMTSNGFRNQSQAYQNAWTNYSQTNVEKFDIWRARMRGMKKFCSSYRYYRISLYYTGKHLFEKFQ